MRRQLGEGNYSLLGDPDYTGEWRGTGTQGRFNMYVIISTAYRREIPTSSGRLSIPVTEMEGLIFDPYGMSAFSGSRTAEQITFTKTYTAAARSCGAVREVEYLGDYVEDLDVFIGAYTVADNTNIGGTFTLNSAKK